MNPEDMQTGEGTQETAADGPVLQDFRVFGVGRAGIHAVEQLCGPGALPGVEVIAVHSDTQTLARSSAPHRHRLGGGTLRGLGSGGDPAVGQAAAERDAAELRRWMEGARMVFIVTGLGAGTGTGAAPVLARIAREAGALVLGVVTLPFQCEGPLRAGHATVGLRGMKRAADAVITVPNQRVLATLDGSTPATAVFEAANRLLVDGVRGLWQLLTRPGLIQLDFASLERLLRGRHSESAFACVEATGENRSREVVDRLLASPFLANDTVLPVADAVLIAVTAGEDVPFAETEGVLERIQAECRQAQVVVGTSVDSAVRDRMVVTLVASVGGSAPLPEVEIPAKGMESAGFERGGLDPEILGGEYLTGGTTGGRSSGGLVPPAPELTAAQRQGMGGRPGLGKKKKVVQTTFNFEMVSRGRFEKTEATILHGEDLDIPTFLRRGVSLN